MKSIKFKLVISFGILIILISSSLGFLALQRSSDSITNEAEEGLQSLAYEGTKLTKSINDTEKKILEMIAGIEDIQSMNLELQQPVLQRQLPKTDFIGLSIVYPDGKTYYSDCSTAELGDRDYVKKAFQEKLTYRT